MYSDRVVSGSNKGSIKDRLGGGSFSSNSSVTTDRQSSLKRQRQDDRNYSFSGDNIQGKPQLSRKAVSEDLMERVQKDLPRSSKNGSQSSVREMHEKMLGGVAGTPPTNAGPPRVSDIKRRSSEELVSATKPSTQNASTPSSTGQKKQAEELTVTSFLKNLGLSKYAITFQAEEVDMIALKHMNDDDLKELGLPMGPRKKILLALSSAKLKR